ATLPSSPPGEKSGVAARRGRWSRRAPAAEVRLPAVSTTPSASAPGPGDLHQEKETEPWAINIPDHPDRSDSPGFEASKRLADKIAGQSGGVDFWGTDAIQMHHG